MKPKFKNALAWEQAQILMQPAFIRVIDNIRKELENTNWRGDYQEITFPYPGYLLCLTHLDYSIKVDIWDLCFQVCFKNYCPLINEGQLRQSHFNSDQDLESNQLSRENEEPTEVDIDTSLIDEAGEVDWQLLETKTQQLVKNIFSNLPHD